MHRKKVLFRSQQLSVLATGGGGMVPVVLALMIWGASPARAQITWGAATNINSDSDVATNGAYFDAALTQQGVNSGSPLTVNGVVFNVIANGNVNVSDASGDITLNSARNPVTGNPSPSGSAAYNTLVANTEYSGSGNNPASQSLVLNHLTVGHTYQVQLWSAAIVALANQNQYNNYITDVNSGSNTAVLNSRNGQYVTGTFTATATSLTFTTSGDPSGFYGVNLVNAVSVRDITNPPSYTWQNVKISGAGATVTDVYAQPLQSGLFYIRTDVGGSYRWNSTTSTWIPLNDSLTFGQTNDFCSEGFAIDPENVNVVYFAGGNSEWVNGAIFKSTNQGTTWTQLTGLSLPMEGNGDQRWVDSRLVVSPFSSSVILFGSRYNGLWRSADGGTTWAQATSLPVGTAGIGVQSIAFDPSTSGRAYAFVCGGAVYVSNDSGATWTSIGGSNVERLKVGQDGTVWCTSSTGVCKYSAGVWTTYTPPGYADTFGAIGINPTNASDVLVAMSEAIFRTTNGGTTWTQESYTVASTATWATPGLNNYGPCDFVFDPSNPSHVWGDRWLTTNINAASVAWVEQESGHEEDVCGAAIAPPSGYELLNGVFDDDGFAMNNGLNAYPTQQLGTTSGYNGHTWSMAYSETTPATMIRLGLQNFYGGTISPVIKSTNGGATWARLTTFPANLFPLDCAVSATNANNYVVVCDADYSSDTTGSNWDAVAATSPWRYTTDGGTTWNVISGLSTPPSFYGPWGINQFLAADHVTGGEFYYLDVNSSNNTTTGKIYSSVNSGASFTEANASSLLPSGMAWYELKSRSGAAGDVWACLDNYPSTTRTSSEGLYHSTNAGVTWTKVSSVNRAFSFGFGSSGGSVPNLYIYGRVGGGTTDALFLSADLGSTWANITSPTNNLADYPTIIEGSRQTAGRVFVGTGGRGFFYGTSNMQIAWGAATNINSDSDVATNGTYVDAALTQQGVNSGSPLTVNGVVFNVIANGNVNVSDASGDITLNSARNPVTGNPSPSGSAAYNTLVANTEYSGSGNNPASQSLVLNHLTVGHTYQVQLWSAAIVAPANQNQYNNYVTDVNSGSNTAVLNSRNGQYVTGTFTATATSLTFTTSGDPSGFYGVNLVNAVSVRDVTP